MVYLLVTWLGVPPKIAMTVLYLVGASLGYIGNRQWAFSYGGSLWRSSMKYLVVHFGGYILTYSLLYIFVDEIGFPHQLVQAAAIIVVAIYLFLFLNFFVFRTQNPEGTFK